MTDIGTGSYTLIAQTAAETMGVPLDKVVVRLGDSSFPVSCGSGGQWGGNNSTAGVYAACMKLRTLVAEQAKLTGSDVVFANGQIRAGSSSMSLADAAGARGLVAEDFIEYGDLDKRFQQSTFGAHFVEVGVDAWTGETRVRRMLAVCACGRILNPKTARSQVIGAMVMGVGAALMEELVVDKRIIATGYNGSVPGAEHCDDVGHDMVNGHCVRTTHAEVNAVAQAARFGAAVRGASCYVNTFPCWGCFKVLAGAGVLRVYYDDEYREDPRVKDAALVAGMTVECVRRRPA
jgi:deoxycytidylate deaminase